MLRGSSSHFFPLMVMAVSFSLTCPIVSLLLFLNDHVLQNATNRVALRPFVRSYNLVRLFFRDPQRTLGFSVKQLCWECVCVCIVDSLSHSSCKSKQHFLPFGVQKRTQSYNNPCILRASQAVRACVINYFLHEWEPSFLLLRSPIMSN